MQFIIFFFQAYFTLNHAFFLFESTNKNFIKYRYKDILFRCALNLTVIYFAPFGGPLLQHDRIVCGNHRL